MSTVAIISVALYIAFQIFSDILSTKIAVMPFLKLAIDGGTVIYPLTFTVRDFLHKTVGKRGARITVMLAAAINVLMVILFWLVGKMQPDASWPFQEAYENILMPVWRITVASIIAEVISELTDTEIFSVIYRKFQEKAEVWGVLASNGVALVLDSVVFSFIAFFGVLPTAVVWEIVVTNILVKGAMSLLSAPAIKLIPRKVKFVEM